MAMELPEPKEADGPVTPEAVEAAVAAADDVTGRVGKWQARFDGPWGLVGSLVIAGLGMLAGWVQQSEYGAGLIATVAVGMVAVVAVVAALAGACGVVVWTARWIVGPLDRAAKATQGRMQFLLIDFLCLFVLAQLPMALIHGWLAPEEAGMRWLFDIFAWCAFGAVWLVSVGLLSRAGIQRPGLRALFLVFVLPGAVSGVIGAPIFASGGIVVLLLLTSGDPVELGVPVLGLAAGGIALAVLIWVSGLVTRWIVAKGEGGGEQTGSRVD